MLEEVNREHIEDKFFSKDVSNDYPNKVMTRVGAKGKPLLKSILSIHILSIAILEIVFLTHVLSQVVNL